MERKNERLPIFTERFRELQGDFSNTEFAKFLGISRQTVGFYWNGDRVPDAVTLVKIAERCDVSTDWLLGIVNDPVSDADDRAISEATGLSGLAISILKRSKRTKKLSDILNVLIEEEMPFAYGLDMIFDDEIEKYPNNALSKNMGTILNGLEKEIEGLGENDEETQNFLWEQQRYERIIKFISVHYKPILTHLYEYLIGWKNAWTDSKSKNLYITEDGEITEDEGKGVPFKQDEVLEYALLFRIQDNIRSLKSRRAMENKEKSK